MYGGQAASTLSTGKPDSSHAAHPPRSGRAFLQPAFFNWRATRALVASFFQAQKATSQASFGRCSLSASWTALSGSIRTEAFAVASLASRDRKVLTSRTITGSPLAWSLWHYLIAAGFALVSAGVAGYLPARQAARLNPVDIIRGAT